MSSDSPRPDRKPLIGLATDASTALASDMVRTARERGHPEVRLAHNAVFGSLPSAGARATDMAQRAGITKQSMGEVVREMTGLGLLETQPDPSDGRAKLVTYTDRGAQVMREGRAYLVELEERFAREVGEDDYETARRVLEWVVDTFTGPSADE